MGLREYQRKRDFSVTPEPRGSVATGEGRSFLVQKHAASRLHYDFRLELDGVLKSWAVPKGPSLDPADKRLALQTEDHPLEYADFEGIIPEGEYGGGTVLVWDRGTWETAADPHEGLRKGLLKFTLHGHKLRGGFALVKLRRRGERADDRGWLLIKEKDAAVRAGFDVVGALPESVLTGRRLEEVASARDRSWHSNRRSAAGAALALDPRATPRARRAGLPEFVAPQLATLTGDPPEGEEWLHEMKLDGYRIQARLANGHVRLLSRKENDWTVRFPAIAEAVARLPARRALLDGEAVVLLPDGRSSFQALQNFMTAGGAGELAYCAFDLLHLDGYDLRASPLEARKDLLRRLLAGASRTLRYSEHVRGSGRDVFREACGLRVEGIVCKRRDEGYRPGRGRDWLKVKCVLEQEVVIGGYTPPSGSRVGIGALLVGVHDASGRLRYAGKVGTGFTDATLADLEGRLRRLEQATSPFTVAPRVARARWVRPDLVAQVAFGEWTRDQKMRHPSFRGLREDKPAREVRRERPSPVPRPAKAGPARARTETVEVAGVRLTHPDRVLYPAQGTTKRDLARFYESIADWIVPHLQGRPTTLVRCPEGAQGQCFYQKHSGPWAPDSLRRVAIRETKKVDEYLVVEDLPGLIGLVQIGVLEIHTWSSMADRLEQPDRLVFDLDPDVDLPWERVAEAARLVRRTLLGIDLDSFVKTTGGKGLHVVVPLQRGPTWDEVAGFAEAVAQSIAAERPHEYVATMSKARRKGKVFIDYMRNYRGATSVAAYSTRARPRAPVSVPLRWEELDRDDLRSDSFDVSNLAGRLASLRSDPWADYWTSPQRLTGTRRRATARRR